MYIANHVTDRLEEVKELTRKLSKLEEINIEQKLSSLEKQNARSTQENANDKLTNEDFKKLRVETDARLKGILKAMDDKTSVLKYDAKKKVDRTDTNTRIINVLLHSLYVNAGHPDALQIISQKMFTKYSQCLQGCSKIYKGRFLLSENFHSCF